PAEEPTLEFDVFGNRLDHEVGVRAGCIEIGARRDPPERRELFGSRDLALLDAPREEGLDALAAPVDQFLADVEQADARAGSGAGLGDARAHGAGTEHGDAR